jgi:hypothetical protein
MKKAVLVALAVVCFGGGSGLLGQLTGAEQAEYDKWEEFLRTARVVAERQLERIEGVTTPWALTLEKDGVEHKALWKDAFGERVGGFKETWKGEIAAYRLSRHLGLHMVPATVEREFRGNRGSCQLWFDAWVTMEAVRHKKLTPPGLKVNPFFRCLFLQRAFDNLISNEDRHLRNYLIMDDWRMILIDHSRSFRTAGKFTKSLIYTAKHREGPKLMSELPRDLVEKIKALDADTVRAAVGSYLSDEEIRAVVTRRGLILQEIDRLVRVNGEDKVFY